MTELETTLLEIKEQLAALVIQMENLNLGTDHQS